MIRTLRAAFLGGGLIAGMATSAQAVEWQTLTDPAPRSSMHLKVYGETLAPIGYVNFCKAYAEQCSRPGKNHTSVTMTDQRWAELERINEHVNAKVEPVTDQELYSVAEHWTYPQAKGDCEDYVLLKKYYLTEMGWPPEALLITVVLDEQKAGHAVLTVATDLGDLVLDNQNRAILPWQDTPYRYIKRQSQAHPSIWVSLDPTYRSKSQTALGRLNTER